MFYGICCRNLLISSLGTYLGCVFVWYFQWKAISTTANIVAEYLPHARRLHRYDPSSEEYSHIWRIPLVIVGSGITIEDTGQDPPLPHGRMQCGILTRLLDNYAAQGFKCPYPSCGMYLGYGTPRWPGGTENTEKLCVPYADPRWMLDHWTGYHMQVDGRIACPGKLTPDGSELPCGYITTCLLNLECHLHKPSHDTHTRRSISYLAKKAEDTRSQRLGKMPSPIYFDPVLYNLQNSRFKQALAQWNATHIEKEPATHLRKIYDDYVVLFGEEDAVYDISLDIPIIPATQPWPVVPRTQMAPEPVIGQLMARPEVS